MKILKKSLIVAATCLFTLSGSAISGGSEIETYYYKTAAKQEVVGVMVSGCGSRPMMWGTRTAYYTTQVSPCFNDRR